MTGSAGHFLFKLVANLFASGCGNTDPELSTID
jgi:hypothetical protein